MIGLSLLGVCVLTLFTGLFGLITGPLGFVAPAVFVGLPMLYDENVFLA
jgi:hypothetical protein